MTRKSVSLLHVAAAVLFLSASSESALAQTVSFIGHADFAAGSNPASVAAGDFNRDGVLDLATANYGSNNVSVLLGNGDGTFQAAQTYATAGFNPEFVAVGDVNLDGRQDLAVAQSGSTPSLVSVLLGNGDGSFQPARIFATGQGSLSVAIGDVNGDGRPDLVAANYYSNDVSVLLGNGDGTFQAAQSFPTAGMNPVTVAVGDFNGDGRPDLAVTNGANTTSGAVPGNLAVLLGNGDGTFQAARTIDVGITPAFVAVRDVNGDGRPDLAVANFRSNDVSVLLGNGDGTFQAPRNFDTGTGPLSIAVGDVNSDGQADLAVANFDFNIRGPNTVSVLLGNGDGTFQAAQAFSAGTNPASVAVGDFNGDVRQDLAVGNFNSDNVSVLINNTAVSSSTFTLTVTKAGNGSGTVTSSPPGINCGATCSAVYDSGTVVTLTATPDAGSTVTGGSGCDAVSGTTCTVTMNAARAVTASFSLQTFTLSVNKTGLLSSGMVTSSDGRINCGAVCSAAYSSGSTVVLTATPTGLLSIFTGWSGCDATSGTTCTVTMGGARSVTANFLP